MTDITWYIALYMCFQVFIAYLMVARIYRVYKQNKANRLRKNFKLIEGENVERKIRS